MVAPIESHGIIAKLLEKTEAGRIDWRGSHTTFECVLEDKYRFEITKDGDTYTIVMKDDKWNEIFTVSVQEELIYGNEASRLEFEVVRDLYELARRIAFDVDKKIAGVSDLLDKI
jgi:hypothetical protein